MPPFTHSAAVRELLHVAFSNEELTTFCFDHFHPVHADFGSDMTISRKIAQIDRRLAVLEQEFAHLKESDLFRLAEQHKDSKQRRQDLLEALAADVTRRIVETRAQIASWSNDGHNNSQRMVSRAA